MSWSPTPTVDRSFFLTTAAAFLRHGFDLAVVCRELGQADLLDGGQPRIPLERVSPLFDAAERHFGDPAYVFRLAEGAPPSRGSHLLALLPHASTPLQMMRLICRYSALSSDAVACELSADGTEAVLRVHAHPTVYVSTHQLEMAVWMMLDAMRQALPAMAGGWSVEFSHAERFDVGRYARLFGCSVRFGRRSNLIRLRAPGQLGEEAGDGAWPDAPKSHVAAAAPLGYLMAEAERYEANVYAHGDHLSDRVTQLFARRLALGEPRIEDIARPLLMSPRTLQRCLQAEGSSWRAATERARRKVAEDALRHTPLPVADIARLAGYQDLRAFLRAFRRWNGQTPTAFRQSALGPSLARPCTNSP